MTLPLNITLAQINPTVGDLAGNKDKILRAWKTHEASDLIVFSELVVCGYPPEDLILKPAFIDSVHETVETLAREGAKFKSGAIIGAPWRINGKIYNTALLIENGAVKHAVIKHHLPNYGVFDEQRIFSAGALPDPVEFRGRKLGVMVCEDMWFPDVSAHLKAKGADILIAPHASPFTTGKQKIRLEHAQSRVKETGLPLLYVNQIGGQDELVFDGASFALNEEAQIIAQLPAFEEKIDDGLLMKDHRKNNSIIPHPSSLIYKALCLGLRDYIAKNNFPGVLIGMSGGIDSAISAAIAADALGPDKVRCVMMPSRFTSADSLEDARACAALLGVSYETIPIDASMASFTTIIPGLEGVAHENIQPRIRGLILMALSNQSGYMVLSTGNKSEMAVGYATLYGDMCGGFNVLKDVYKTQVYALSRWRNEQGHVIPERIITKVPTAELRDNQTDQDTLPPYDILDGILQGLIEDELSVAQIAAQGFDEATVRRVWQMLDRAEYKRRQAAPGVKITARAFGRDRRYPITNAFLKQVEK